MTCAILCFVEMSDVVSDDTDYITHCCTANSNAKYSFFGNDTASTNTDFNSWISCSSMDLCLPESHIDVSVMTGDGLEELGNQVSLMLSVCLSSGIYIYHLSYTVVVLDR